MAVADCAVEWVACIVAQVEVGADEQVVGWVVVDPREAHFVLAGEAAEHGLRVVGRVVLAGCDKTVAGEQFELVDGFGELVAVFEVADGGKRTDFRAVADDLYASVFTVLVHVEEDREGADAVGRPVLGAVGCANGLFGDYIFPWL